MKSKNRVFKTKGPEKAATEAVKVDINAAYNVFSKAFRLLKEGTKAWKEFLVIEYQRCFGMPVPVDVHWALICSKIEYHLLVVEGYQKAKIPVSAKMQQNYDASQALDIDKFHKDTVSLLTLSAKRMGKTTKEDAVVKAKKVVKVIAKKSTVSAPAKVKAEKASRVTVSGIFAEIFAANFSKKLNDESIAKEVNAKSKGIGRDHQYSAKDVPVVRRKFNLGLLSGQTGKPKAELEKFEAKK